MGSLPSVLPAEPFQPLPSPEHGPAVPVQHRWSQTGGRAQGRAGSRWWRAKGQLCGWERPPRRAVACPLPGLLPGCSSPLALGWPVTRRPGGVGRRSPALLTGAPLGGCRGLCVTSPPPTSIPSQGSRGPRRSTPAIAPLPGLPHAAGRAPADQTCR